MKTPYLSNLIKISNLTINKQICLTQGWHGRHTISTIDK